MSERDLLLQIANLVTQGIQPRPDGTGFVAAGDFERISSLLERWAADDTPCPNCATLRERVATLEAQRREYNRMTHKAMEERDALQEQMEDAERRAKDLKGALGLARLDADALRERVERWQRFHDHVMACGDCLTIFVSGGVLCSKGCELWNAAAPAVPATPTPPTDAAKPWSSRVTDSMNIYAKRGDKIRFANPDAGYECDREATVQYLTVGAVYTVERTDVGGFHTTVWLQEVPERGFNSVQFADVEATDAATCPKCGGNGSYGGLPGDDEHSTKAVCDCPAGKALLERLDNGIRLFRCTTCGQRTIRTYLSGGYIMRQDPCPTCQPQRKEDDQRE